MADLEPSTPTLAFTKAHRPLRVWQIAELYPPDYGGGAAVYVRDVCRFLAERGHEIRVLCTEGGNRAAYSLRTEYDSAVRVDRMSLPYFRNEDPGGWLLGTRRWLEHRRRVEGVVEEILGGWQPDLVQFHTPNSPFEECLDSVTKRRIPAVGMLHCAWLICPRMRLMRSPTSIPCSGPGVLKCLECLYSHWDGSHAAAAVKLPWRLWKLGAFPAFRLWSRNRTRRATDGLIGYSQFMTDAHAGLIDGPVEHISLGVNLEGLPLTLPDRPRSPLRFGFVGGFQEHKGIWDVLDAAASLKDRGLPFELRLWGPRQRPEPVAERDLGDRVVLRGMFAPEERWSVFSEFDVLLMATRDLEPYGRVVQEAAAVGVPTIAPATGGITEQIRDGIDGLLFRFLDPKDLESKMASLIKNPGLVREFSSNLRPVIDTRDAVANIESFYEAILSGDARAPRAR